MMKAFPLSAMGMIAGLALAGAAQAQAPAAPAPAAAADSAYSDEQVKKFAGALGALQKVNAEYGPKVAAATGDAKGVAQNEMATKMHEALTAAGLTPTEYSAMAAAVKTDEQLNARVAEQLSATTGSAQ